MQYNHTILSSRNNKNTNEQMKEVKPVITHTNIVHLNTIISDDDDEIKKQLIQIWYKFKQILYLYIYTYYTCNMYVYCISVYIRGGLTGWACINN